METFWCLLAGDASRGGRGGRTRRAGLGKFPTAKRAIEKVEGRGGGSTSRFMTVLGVQSYTGEPVGGLWETCFEQGRLGCAV